LETPSLLARRTDDLSVVLLTFEGTRLLAVSPTVSSNDLDLPWISPGWIDLQVNGYEGLDFAAMHASDVAEVTTRLTADGVTRYLPTITTNSFETTRDALSRIANALRESPKQAFSIPGIHLEGPYISREDGPRGAHPRIHCREYSWDEFLAWQDVADGNIRLLTLSPEYPGADIFIQKVVKSGVIVAIGHTAASSQQIAAAVDAGATFSTHLGNGCHAQLPRHPNYLWDQLANDRLMASFIADGFHVPPSTLKAMIRAKGVERSVLISDVTSLAGVPPGRYETGLGEVEVLEDGRLVVAGQRTLLAGAALPLELGVANVMNFAELTLQQAITLVTDNPARLLGLPPPRLKDGRGDLVLFFVRGDLPRRQVQILGTIQGGELVYFS
jgi:N-acetylglucosamine-6-phosphate deacetylase